MICNYLFEEVFLRILIHPVELLEHHHFVGVSVRHLEYLPEESTAQKLALQQNINTYSTFKTE